MHWKKLTVLNNFMLNFAVFGESGKMGSAVLQTYKESFKANLKLQSIETAGLHFIIDFTSPKGSLELATKMQGFGGVIICGTTGFKEEEFAQLKVLAEGVKILYSANFSLGVFKFLKIAKLMAKEFEGYEVEIVEKHHKFKKDAPSGTALKIANTVGVKNVKIESVREGEIFGFHEVSFKNNEERIWLGHEAFNRQIFASGAIKAGIKATQVLAGKQSGFFSLEDIF